MKSSLYKNNVIYEDDYLIAIDKASGMLTIPDRYDADKPNLYNRLLDRYKSVFIIHRLDVETSGVILFAKDAQVHKAMNSQFESGRIQKTYWAITVTPSESVGSIDAPISKAPARNKKYFVTNSGRSAKTDYRVIHQLGPYSLTELKPMTGRTHQIRVHMEYIGAPLMVDALYGHRKHFYLSEIRKLRKKPVAERPLLSRSCLHAQKLEFEHPVSLETVTIEAPLHKDMKATINQLKKVYSQ